MWVGSDTNTDSDTNAYSNTDPDARTKCSVELDCHGGVHKSDQFVVDRQLDKRTRIPDRAMPGQ
jgi:hypothetical protein